MKNWIRNLFAPGADKPAPDPQAWLDRAQQLRADGQLEPAARAYESALEAGADAATVLLQLGAVRTQLDDFPAAEQAFARLVQLDPGHADGWCMLGVVTKDQGRFGEAVGHFGKALALKPDFSEAHFNLGLAQFESRHLADASASFARCAELQRGAAWGADAGSHLSSDPSPAFEPRDMATNEVKLQHDVEQLEMLRAQGALPAAFDGVLDDYRALRDELRDQVDVDALVSFDETRHPLVARTYKRPIHIAQVPPPAGDVVNPSLDWDAVQDRYLAAQPNVLAVDDLLTPQALAAVRRFCRESTFWNNIKAGYLGAYFYDGFCSELLLRLAWELREKMPRVIGHQPLQMMWGYKCDANMPALGVHADAAAVNVNFWITEDEANLDPDTGGLLVYERNAPRDWDFRMYNMDSEGIEAHLASLGSEPTRYPYRANRAIIFDSDLFHASDRPRFREGYANRRINITLLYGNRLAT